MNKRITSPQNKSIKSLLQLQDKSRNRRKEGLFVVEGIRELHLAVQAGYTFKELYLCPELISSAQRSRLNSYSEVLIEVTEEVYRKIAYRTGTEGVIGIGIQKQHDLRSLQFKNPEPLILVAEAPEKPGNIGALLRTADAANLDAVLIANPRTDLYNPNIIRSSVGCLFTNQVATGSSEEIIAFLKEKQVSIFCAALQSSLPYTEPDYRQASALVVGTEAEGLNPEWLANSTQNIVIPMQGKIDSMNVSVAAGILIFEAKRQRNFK